MLYDELTRVGEIDTQISDLHDKLTLLYSERGAILNRRLAKAEAEQLEATTQPGVSKKSPLKRVSNYLLAKEDHYAKR